MNQSDPFGAYGVYFGLKLIHLVQIEDLGPNNVIDSSLDTLGPKEQLHLFQAQHEAQKCVIYFN